jgi:hypothetical protein
MVSNGHRGRETRTAWMTALAALALISACSETAVEPPIAVIEGPNAALVAEPVQLDGAQSFDPSGLPLGYTWSFLDVPSGSEVEFNDPTLVNPSFVPDIEGTYFVALVVRTRDLVSAPDTLAISVTRCGAQPPVVESVENRPRTPGTNTRVRLTASVSDPDNAADCGFDQDISFFWVLREKPSGSRALINDSSLVAPEFLADVSGDYTVELQLTDSTNRVSEVFEHTVRVRDCGEATPVVDEATARPANPAVGDVVQLSSVVSDADNDEGCEQGQTFSFFWRLSTRPVGSTARIEENTRPEPNFIPDVVGEYVAELIVTDSTGRDSDPFEVPVTAGECGTLNPDVDSVEAEPLQPNVGELVTLTVAVSDPDNDPEGCGLEQALVVSTEFLERPAGSAAEMSPAEGLSPGFVPDVSGTYVLLTTVTDETGNTAARETTVEASACGEAPPTIDNVSTEPESPRIDEQVRLTLSISDGDTKPDGCNLPQALTVSSSFVSLPPGSTAVVSPTTGTNPGFVPDVPGQYVVRSRVSDDTGRSTAVDTLVEVGDCGANVPTISRVELDPDVPNTGDEISLTLTVVDRDNETGDDGCDLGQILTVESDLVARPAGSDAALAPSEGRNPGFLADLPGEYVVRSTVTDDTGRSSSIDTTIPVSSCGSAPPTFETVTVDPAAPNTGDAVTLAISVADPDNTDAACALEQDLEIASRFVRRPPGSTAALSTSVGPAPGFVADIPGLYTIRSTVTDPTGRSAERDTDVDVSVCGSVAPVIDGISVSPANPNTGDGITFTVDATDDDEISCGLAQGLTIVTEFVSRPAGSEAVLSTSEGRTPAFVADLPGEYVIRVVVTDLSGRSATDTASVTVSTCGSAAPSIDAVVPTPANPNTGDPITFAIAVSDQDNVVSCGANQTLTVRSILSTRPAGSTATLTTELGTAPAFIADLPGLYELETTVRDGTGRRDTRRTQVTVSTCGAATPTVSSVTPSPASPNTGDAVTLSIAVSDADNAGGGCDLNQVLTTSSSFIARPAGSTATLSTRLGLTPGFIADLPGTYVVRTVVADDTGRSASVDTTVTASTCGAADPSVDAVVATPASPNVGDAVAFAIAVSDSDNAGGACDLGQVLTTSSAFIAQPAGSTATLLSSAGLTPAFVADVPGTYTIQTTVVDDTGRSATVDTSVVVSTCGAADPSVDGVTVVPASPNVGDGITLQVAVSDADNLGACALGQTLAVASRFSLRPAGSTATLSTSEGVRPAFVADLPGDYVVVTTVTDSTGRTDSVSTPVTVSTCGAAAPVVDAIVANPASPNTGSPVTVSITVSDADNSGGACSLGQDLAVASTFVARPAGSTATLSIPNGLSPTFTPDAPGTYTVRTTVTDETGLQGTRDLAITVSTCGAAAPNVDAVAVAPAAPNTGDAVALSVTVSDADNLVGCALGQILDVSSVFLARPVGSTATLSTALGLAPAFVADRPGVYIVRTTVADGTGRSDFSDTTITVSACGSSSPSVDAVAFSPASPNTGAAITIVPTLSDADNLAGCALGQTLVASYALLSRPATSTAVVDGPEFIADVPGDYQVRVTVSDGTGRTGSRDATVTASVCGSRAPAISGVSVNPPAPQSTQTVTLTITASDADNDVGCALGQTLTFASQFVARPAGSGATLSTAGGTTPQFVADVPGTYSVETTVTDSTGRSSVRTTDIVVDDCGSNAPTIDGVTAAIDATPVAGPPFDANTGDVVELTIAASDLDNTTCGLSQSLTVSSELVAQPAGSSATLVPTTGPLTALATDVPGTYTLRVSVADGTGRSDSLDFDVEVADCGDAVPNAAIALLAPVAFAEDGLAGPVPSGSLMTLSGAGSSDPDDGCLPAPQELSYSWSFSSVPFGATPSFNSGTIEQPSFQATLDGVYVVRLTVSDGEHEDSTTLAIEASPAGDLFPADGLGVNWVDGAGGSTALWNDPRGLIPSDDGILVAQAGSDTITSNESPAEIFVSGGRLVSPFDITQGGSSYYVANGLQGGGGGDAIVRISETRTQSRTVGVDPDLTAPRGIVAFEDLGSGDTMLLVTDGTAGLVLVDPTTGVVDSHGFEDDCPLWGLDAIVEPGDERVFVASPACHAIFVDSPLLDAGPFDHIARVPDARDVTYDPINGMLYVAGRGGIWAVEDCGALDGSCATGCLLDGLDDARGVQFDSDERELLVTAASGNLFRVSGDFGAAPTERPACGLGNVPDPAVEVVALTNPAEGDPVVFAVQSDEVPFEAITVNLSFAGTAGALDYDDLGVTSVVLSPGELFETVTLPTFADSHWDSASGFETVILQIDAVSGAGATIDTPTATAFLLDGDSPPQVTVAANQPTVVEGGVAGFEVALDVTTFEDVVVSFNSGALGDTATLGPDYAPIGGPVTVFAGATTASINFNVNADGLPEPAGERFTITLTGASGGDALLATPNSATMVIVNAEANTSVDLETISGLDEPAGTGGEIIDGVLENGRLGELMAAGDVNGDELDDLVFLLQTGDTAQYAVVVLGSVTGFGAGLDLDDLSGLGTWIELPAIASDEVVVGPVADVNGDGLGDMIFGLPDADPDGLTDAGAVLVFFGRESMPIVMDIGTLSGGEGGFTVPGRTAGQRLGVVVAGVLDMDGDCFAELAFGDADDVRYLVYGRRGWGASFDINQLNGENGAAFAGPTQSRSDFPGAIASVYDLDDDGFDDIAFGFPFVEVGGFDDAGVVHVVYGGQARFDTGARTLDGSDGAVFVGGSTDRRLGFAMTGVFDFGGDRIGDLAIGAPGALGAAGVVYVIPGGAWSGVNDAALAAVTGATITGGNEGLGVHVSAGPVRLARLGTDIVISDRLASWVVYGEQSGALTVSTSAPGSGFGFTPVPVVAPEELRSAAPSLTGFDFDGDSHDDVLVGDPSANIGGLNEAGVVTLFQGGTLQPGFFLQSDGDDFFATGSGGHLILDAGAGSDTIFGLQSVSILTAAMGRGADTYVGSLDALVTLVGGEGDDQILPNQGGNLDLCREGFQLAAASRLRVSGLEIVGDDGGFDSLNVFGSARNEQIAGRRDGGVIDGRQGDDTILGGGVTDFLFGGYGDDFINAGGGNDEIQGGPGSDELIGNTGADTFLYDLTDATDEQDIIRDFGSGADVIDLTMALTAVAFDPLVDDVDDFVFFDQVGSDTVGSFDPDGLGPADAVPFALIEGFPNLGTATDWVSAGALDVP